MSRDAYGTVEIGLEIFDGLPRLAAVIIRERMRGDFLFRAASYLLDEAGREVQWIIAFAMAQEFRIGIEILFVITRAECRFKPPPFLPGRSKEETGNRPGGGDAVTLEQFQQTRNGFARPEQVRAVRPIGRLMIANAPVELKIERDYERSVTRPRWP